MEGGREGGREEGREGQLFLGLVWQKNYNTE